MLEITLWMKEMLEICGGTPISDCIGDFSGCSLPSIKNECKVWWIDTMTSTSS